MAAPKTYQTGVQLLAALDGTERVLVDNGSPQNTVATTAAIAALAENLFDQVNTALTTAVGDTLTGAALVGGVITRSGPTAVYTDTTDTAANIIAALPTGAVVGTALPVSIKNTVPFNQTIAAGSGVTLAGQTIIPPNSVGNFLMSYTAAGAITLLGISVVPLTTMPLMVATALTTVGAGTITAAGIVGGITNRTGSTAAFTDTSDTAVAIIAALPNANIGQSFEYNYYNNTLGAATITGGVGVTVSGAAIVPANMWCRFLVTYTAAGTVTMVGLLMGPNVALPASKYTSGSAATFAAGSITGANVVNYENTGSNAALTVRTAAQMFADIPNCQIGFSYQLFIRNTNATGATITADGGATVTLTGTMTIAQNVTRMFNVVFPTAATCTIQSMGISAAAA